MATFKVDQCHHRGADGQPDCRNKRLKSANLCDQHEREYRAGTYRALRTGYGGGAAVAEAPKRRGRPPKSQARPAGTRSSRGSSRQPSRPTRSRSGT